MGLIFTLAADLTREMKIDYEAFIESAIVAAETACNGYTVTRAGQREGMTTDRLFRGNEAHAYKWATPELIEHWGKIPRPSLSSFEARWIKAKGDEWAVIEKLATR